VRRRVVITGVGAVGGLGLGLDALWDGLIEGRSGVGAVRSFDASGFRCALGAEVADLRIREHVPKSYRKATKVMARDTELAVAAADLAVRDAALLTRAGGDGEATYPASRLGCHIGAGLIATELDEITVAMASAGDEQGRFDLRLWGERGIGDLQPLWMLKYLPNMPACHVGIVHGAEGPSNTITCGEASGLLCIGESSRVIERGGADACLSGGAESKVNPTQYLRAQLTGWLAEAGADETVDDVVRPFDEATRGSVPGEGGGILVLEELDGACARGARVYAEVKGFGAAQSAPPFDGPDLGGRGDVGGGDGLASAIRSALADAGASPDDVGAVVPLGCGAVSADHAEAAALRAVFGGRGESLPLVLWTPAIGNCHAGNGALQAGIAGRVVSEGRVPSWASLDGARGGAKDASGLVVTCSPALCGQNAALVLGAA